VPGADGTDHNEVQGQFILLFDRFLGAFAKQFAKSKQSYNSFRLR
jgi:hypothetical protein